MLAVSSIPVTAVLTEGVEKLSVREGSPARASPDGTSPARAREESRPSLSRCRRLPHTLSRRELPP